MSAASVRYRDLPYIVGHALWLWFLVSPIIFPSAQVPERFRALVSMNPLPAFVIAYQDVLLYNMAVAADIE